MLEEIFQSIASNKSRSFTTGLGVTWGIFILVILLGVGKGFEVGVFQDLNDFSRNSVWFYCRETSLSYNGFQPGRKIRLKDEDIKLMKKTIHEIEYISPEVTIGRVPVIANKESQMFDVKGIYPEYFKIKTIGASEGRVINELDLKENRNVAFIGKDVREILLKYGDPIGKYLLIKGNYFKVVGIIKNSQFTIQEAATIYIPASSYSEISNKGKEIKTFAVSITKGKKSKKLEKKIKNFIAQRYDFDPNDNNAVFTWNLDEQAQKFENLFKAISYFLWFVGISTLISGIIGVGNIMFVIVKERTKEIGIRKAVGAKKGTILKLVLLESIIITSIAGYLGLILGVSALEGIGIILNSFAEEGGMKLNPQIDFSVAVSATVLLIIAGTLAGYFPANRAANINPVDALRDE